MEVLRLLIDVLEVNPEMDISKAIIAMDLHKCKPDENPKDTFERVNRVVWVLRLLGDEGRKDI
jgi:hypothetical protein